MTVKTIHDLQHNVSVLRLAGLPATTVSQHAALQIMDRRTLAVVPLGNQYTDLIEQAITNQDLGAKDISITRGVITIQI